MGTAQISDGAELVGLLLKGWEIEKRFECVSLEESDRYATWSQLRQLMPRLISDSNEHLSLVESMVARVKTDRRKWDFPQRVSKFPFHLSWDEEMAKEIARVERRMMENYSDILVRLEASDSSAYLAPADREFVLEGLKRLVREEDVHYRLATSVLEPPKGH